MDKPRTNCLSVVVVPLTGRIDYLERCLTGLTTQSNLPEVEILVPFDCDRNQISILRDRWCVVRFIEVEGKRTCAELRAIGVRNSSGVLVAITEDHCEPAANWCSQIVTEHVASHAAVGGAVEKARPGSAVSWALYLCDYLRYMNPVDDGPSRNLTDCNVSYKRSALDRIAEAWKVEFHEPVVHASLEAGGDSLWLSSKLVVKQERESSVSAALWDRYAYGRLFGAMRVSNERATQRIMFSLFAVVLPALLMGRIARDVVKKRRCGIQFCWTLPLLILLSVAWTWGEFLGYVTGGAAPSLSGLKSQTGSPRPRQATTLIQ